ncbi:MULTISPECIES: DMT family transporter [unclassified Pseudomonas]|uniref:DMT family transporter n=1 Tax=unclassified Pseudomonas TaxID=196821 RepID=UPI0011A12477|nr:MULTISPECIES: DMT family transporter [unclassified Pseudomonas]TWC12442.1 EamA domain-containing membrane protein RarD [Pseudomonas sp. SJZ083]TWC41233.1 EamA domain-containing membrane protein RarD [Pseudomonas sp. SJZ077]WNF57801.1 DMT family transporter [Pseudomonas sp. SG20052]
MSTSQVVDRSLQGIGLCTLGYMFLTLQDAVIKWLVTDYSVVTILFWRSLVVVVACLLAGRLRLVQRAWRSPSRRLLVVRGLLSIVAWLLYYTAARDLSLAEMTTLYFSAPIMVTVLAAVILKERASGWQWFSLILGFVGVIIACRPSNIADPWPIVLTLLAAMCWAFTYIQLRQVDDQTSVLEQMLITNVVFVLCMTVALPWTFTPAPTPAWLGMLVAGLVGGIGQFLLFASFQRATATLLAPFEYTGLIWAFLLSSLIWGTLMDVSLMIGAGLIAVSGTLAMIFGRHPSQDVVGAECSVTQPLYPAATDVEAVGGAEGFGVETPLDPESVEHRR